MKKTILAFAVATFGLAGCMTYDPYTGGEKTSSATKGSIELVMPGNITFDLNESSIKPAFSGTLESVALVLKEYDKTIIQIEGHTDSSGSDSYNQLLSERRASSVRDFLLNQGIAPKRTRAVGYGERYPVASNDTAAGREQNRRVELTLVPMQ